MGSTRGDSAGPRLVELRIRNLAVIHDVTLEPGDGLTVLSGETGAGKSLLVEALSLLVGERASTELIRDGMDRTLIEGRFDPSGDEELARRLAEGGFGADDDWLILRREVRRNGRSRAWINGSPATAGGLKRLGQRLFDLHGQHEHQTLLRPASQRDMLDACAGSGELARLVAAAYAESVGIRAQMDALRRRAAETFERADYLRFKIAEIEAAALEPGEDERLGIESKRLENSGSLLELTASAYERTYAGEDSIVDHLAAIGRTLAEIQKLDPAATDFFDLHETALRTSEELGRLLAAYREEVPHDTGRLEVVRGRLDELFRLKSKYGPELSGVIAAGCDARAEVDALESSEQELDRLESESSAMEDELSRLAGELSAARRDAAPPLERAVEAELPGLGLEGGRFEVRFTELDEITASGVETIEFLVSLNAGFELAPLGRVVSGGELSRVMLALKTSLTGVEGPACLLFDEIDAGIGGEVAHRVADRLSKLAAAQQVFVVTHLAQIAARSDGHFVVEKSTGEKATASVRSVAGGDRVRELARMLGGDPDSDRSRSHAEELLGSAG